MELSDSVMKDISARVRVFCDDVISGKVEKDLLERHQINMFSQEGKAYIDTLTARILDIWQQ